MRALTVGRLVSILALIFLFLSSCYRLRLYRSRPHKRKRPGIPGRFQCCSCCERSELVADADLGGPTRDALVVVDGQVVCAVPAVHVLARIAGAGTGERCAAGAADAAVFDDAAHGRE